MTTEKGRIVKGFGELFTVLLENGRTLECSVRGILKHNGVIPLVGDVVTAERMTNGRAAITEVAERKNSLIRPPVANLDRLFIVAATASPDPSLENIDKLTCAAEARGIEPVLVATKTDLSAPDELFAALAHSGIKTYATSCVGKTSGIEELRGALSGICAFAGASGVGKSSLLNALFPSLSLAVGSVSERLGRGRHTTRTVELFPFDGGFLADTPGFGSIDFERFDFLSLDELARSFPEFRAHLGKCRYTDCTHTKEDGCAVLAALERGEISKRRHESYEALYAVLKTKKERLKSAGS